MFPETVDASLSAIKKEDTYIATYRLPAPGLEATNLYYPWGQQGLRLTISRWCFRVIDASRWLPACLAAIPLKLCQKEIIEFIWGCDPDVVVLSDIRWAKQLSALLRRHFSGWSYVERARQPFDLVQEWRKYDPSALVSIALPTYNGSKYIRQSIGSCLRQTHAKIELIVVDDGSREDIGSILNEYDDPRIRYIRHPKNLGIAQALNTGFRHATGSFLTWTSDDNYYADNAIEEMVRFLQTYPEIDFVYSERYIKDEEIPDQDWTIQRTRPPESLKIENPVGPCFLYKRAVSETIGEYNPKTFLSEDYDYWIRVSRKFRMQRLLKPLYYYRYHKDSLTGKHSLEERMEKIKFVKKLHGIPSK